MTPHKHCQLGQSLKGIGLAGKMSVWGTLKAKLEKIGDFGC